MIFSESCRFASRIGGICYQCSAPFDGRHCYQKLLGSPVSKSGFGCDLFYIMWSAAQSRCKSSNLSEQAACIAYSSHDEEHVDNASEPWWLQQNGISVSQQDASLKVTASTLEDDMSGGWVRFGPFRPSWC